MGLYIAFLSYILRIDSNLLAQGNSSMDSNPRRLIILLLILSCTVLSVLFYAGVRFVSGVARLQQAMANRDRIKELPPLTLPEAIRGPEAEEMVQMYLKAASLGEYYRIPNSSTLYLVLHNYGHKEETYFQTANSNIKSATGYDTSVALIDLEYPNRSVFTTLFQAEVSLDPADSTQTYSNSQRHEIRASNACLVDGVPSAILYRTDEYPRKGELADPNRDANSDFSNYGSYIALDAEGFHEIKRNNRTHEFYRPIRSSSFLFDNSYPIRLMEIERWAVKERYTLMDRNKPLDYGKRNFVFDSVQFEFNALREDFIYGVSRDRSKIVFIKTFPQPVIREFNTKELFDLLPIQPEDLTLEYYQSLQYLKMAIEPANSFSTGPMANYDPAQHEWRQWHREPLRFYPLSRGNDSSLLVQLIMPNRPILRIHIDKITNGPLSEIVEFIGNCDEYLPQQAIANDSVILFNENHYLWGYDFNPPQPKSTWTYSIARFQDRSHLGSIETITAALPHETTDYISRSDFPFDDDHFLLAFDKAFYTLRWDGTEIKRVFPR